MTTSCAGINGLLSAAPCRRLSGHGNSPELDYSCVRCSAAMLRRPGPNANCRLNASASAAPLETSEPSTCPPVYKDVWIPPNPSKFIKNRRAFVEEHRWVRSHSFWHVICQIVFVGFEGTISHAVLICMSPGII